MTKLLSLISASPAMPSLAFWRGFTSGLAAPTYLYSAPRYVVPHATVEDAFRADWEQVGADFRSAIDTIREEVQE